MLPFLQFIIAIVIIISAAKVGGYLSYRLGQPAVAGEVLMGLILGPSLLDLLGWPVFSDQHLGESITHLAELGVLLLMFIAGLDLHLSDLLKSGKVAALMGILGFGFSLGAGYILAIVFSFPPQQALFIGLLMAPTSVSISAQTLMELKVLRSRVGVGLMGAAVVDDTMAVLGISLFLAFLGGGAVGGLVAGSMVLLRMVLYVIVASAVGFLLIPRLSQLANKLPISQGLIAFTFVTLLLYAWSAEALGSMATIMGAFLAGLFFARSPLKNQIEKGLSPLTYGVFVPIFFVNVGLGADVSQLTAGGLWWLLLAMVGGVVFAKAFGGLIAGRVGGWTNPESLQLGLAMIPLGEVVLIIATVGVAEGLIGADIFSAAVGLVIATTLLTPPLLKLAFSSRPTAFEIEED